VAGAAGGLAGEQAERTSNAADPMTAQDPFTNAARFRRCRPGTDACRERGSRQCKTPMCRMRINIARPSFICRSPLIPNDPRASSTYRCFDSTRSRSPRTEPSHRSSGSSSVCSAARRRARSSYHPVTHLRRSVISGSSSLYAAKSSSGKTLTPARWSRIVSRSRSGS
jgi:hypothetical protein